MRALEWLVDRHRAVVAEVAGLPGTIVHGDCSASNVLVDRSTGRVCPVDWETAAVGPGLLDLAALTAGWPPADACRIADGYRTALGPAAPSAEVFESALDHCRLQLHMQWLGWAPGWVPPEEHRQDHLGDALVLAERLAL